MFNPESDNAVVKKLKDSLKIDEEGSKPEPSSPQTPDEEPKRKRRHGLGFKLKERVKKSMDQVKLISRFTSASRKKTLKSSRDPKPSTPLQQSNEKHPDSEPESRLDLIFRNLGNKRN